MIKNKQANSRKNPPSHIFGVLMQWSWYLKPFWI